MGIRHRPTAPPAQVEEGVVPGGGVALIRALSALDSMRAGEDEKVGINIVRNALEDPCRWIASNAGWEGSVVVDKIKKNKGPFGFNAATEEFEDLSLPENSGPDVMSCIGRGGEAGA